MANSRVRSDNKSRLKGVIYYPRKQKWRARIVKNGKNIHLGLFATADEAAEAYVAAAKRLHGEFARAG